MFVCLFDVVVFCLFCFLFDAAVFCFCFIVGVVVVVAVAAFCLFVCLFFRPDITAPVDWA